MQCGVLRCNAVCCDVVSEVELSLPKYDVLSEVELSEVELNLSKYDVMSEAELSFLPLVEEGAENIENQ